MRFDRVDRRTLIALAGGVVAAWPLRLRAQQTGHIPRIAVLMNVAADHPEGQPRLAAFVDAMQKLGWRDGDTMRMDVRWGADDADLDHKYAQELVALAPDIILAAGTLGVMAMLRVTHTVPIVFALVTDPVGSGFVDSLAHPGGNATGFMVYDYSLATKWLELLKQFAPGLTRVGVVRDPGSPQGIGQFGAIQSAAPSIGVEVSSINARDEDEIKRNIAAFARSPKGGLIEIPEVSSAGHGRLIVELAAQYKLPTIQGLRSDVTAGGLAFYGPDRPESLRRAADYVDRILKGAKPADLPVQAPTKFELVINLKTAKALGLTVPPALLGRADEIVE